MVARANRAAKLRAAADLIADIPDPPDLESYPIARAVLDTHAGIVCARMSGRTTEPIGDALIAAPLVTALRVDADRTRHPVADALPLVTAAANLGELELLYPAPVS